MNPFDPALLVAFLVTLALVLALPWGVTRGCDDRRRPAVYVCRPHLGVG